MTTLREAAEQALEALIWTTGSGDFADGGVARVGAVECLFPAITALRQAIKQAEQAQPVAFDHAVGSQRFAVVRGAFWWHVRIGDSPTEHGKFRNRAGAERMAADLLKEFRNGAFVQHNKITPPQLKPLISEMRKQMKERCDSMEMRGAFADGWLSAEAAHGIKEQA